MQNPVIGLLPLYLELYDRLLPARRKSVEAALGPIGAALRKRGVSVRLAPVCRIKKEFAAAVRDFEKAGVDAIVTVHLAYSPSLESAEALASSPLPVLVLDTTPAWAFGPDQDPDAIMNNHGIHGVQDLCNLLLRRGKAFAVEAGHGRKSDVIKRLVDWVPAARLAARLKSSRVGRIGKAFAGMGDFSVEAGVLRKRLGVETIAASAGDLAARVKRVSAAEVRAEVAADRKRFDARGLSLAAHERSVRAGLAVRRWVQDERLTGLTMNFESAGRASGLPVMPFLEFSKAMARGTGYAGEGDVLTAALVGALASVWKRTSFTEMFCPDWKGNRVFLSHMGEVNVDLVDGQARLAEPGMNFTPGASPVVPYGRLTGGDAVIVDLAPLAGDRFRLILCPGRMEAVRGQDRFEGSVRGWFRPRGKVADFLAAYSRLGGTHHAALVYGADLRVLTRFAELAGLEGVTVE